MNAVTPITGFGRAVRLATPHRFKSFTTRAQTADPAYLRARSRNRILSIIAWIAVLAVVVWFRQWMGSTIAAAMISPIDSLGEIVSLLGATLLLFLGAFAFMRLGQIALRALLDEDDPAEWPREGVDWGEQTVIVGRDGIAVAMRLARREYPWESLALLTEADVFTLDRRQGDRIVIPKDPEDEDELRERLMRGIGLAKPLS